MREAIAQEVKFSKTDLLPKKDDGRTIREVTGRIAEHIMEKLPWQWNLFGDTAIVVLQTGHFDKTSRVHGGTGDRVSTHTTCSLLQLFDEAAESADDGIAPLYLHEEGGDGDNHPL